MCAMRKFRSGVAAFLGLAVVCTQALGCLPSDFDELARTTQNVSPVCEAWDCDASQAEAPFPDSSVVPADFDPPAVC